MITVDRERVRRVFAAYAARYDDTNPKIKLKIDHTYRVAALCDEISQSLGLAGPDCDLAWLIGMLHDIGRFEQVRRYNTFSDADSVGHASLGVELLFEDDLIRDYLPAHDWDAIIRLAIGSHSLYRLPAGLSERELLFCRLIRDADKIDILKANCLTPMEDIYGTTTEALRRASITPAVLKAFYEEHTVLRALRKTPIDHLISLLSLTYELEFPVSLKIVQQQGYLEKLLSFSSDNPETAAQLAAAKKHMAEYMQKHLA